MPGIHEADALALWESGARLSVLDRAVRMAAAVTGTSPDVAADLPISDRDRLLLAALRGMGGESVAVVAQCPACNELHDAEIALSPLLQTQDVSTPTVKVGRKRLPIRPPSSREMAAAMINGDVETLAARCCQTQNGVIDSQTANAVEAALEAAFPLLNIMIAMRCTGCAQEFAQRLDPVPLLWGHVTRLARRALAEVGLLARAYGWTERDVFALSPARRQFYCEMARQ